MSYTTARLALPLPDGNDGPEGPDVPYWFRQLGDRLETTVVSFDQGYASARPRAGSAGRVYFATDTGVLSFDDGREWRSTTGTSAVQVIGGAGAPAFNAGYSSSQPTRPARFWRDNSRIYLAGTAGGSSNGTIFTLPEGYRPRYEQQFALVPQVPGGAIYPYYYFGTLLSVRTTGVVMVASSQTYATQIPLDGLSFDLER